MSAFDTLVAYKFIKLLVTPFDETEAYERGIIDDEGNILIPRSELVDSKDKRAYPSNIYTLVWNLKKILNKVPGMRNKLSSFAAAMYLLKEEHGYSENQIRIISSESGFKHTEVMLEMGYVNKKDLLILKEEKMIEDQDRIELVSHKIKTPVDIMEARYGKSDLKWDELPEDERYDIADLIYPESKATIISKLSWDEIDSVTKKKLQKALKNNTDGLISLDEMRLFNPDRGFKSGEIEMLRQSYKRVRAIDPSSREFTEIIDMLNSLSDKELKQIIRGDIPYLSNLARNLDMKKSMARSKSINASTQRATGRLLFGESSRPKWAPEDFEVGEYTLFFLFDDDRSANNYAKSLSREIDRGIRRYIFVSVDGNSVQVDFDEDYFKDDENYDELLHYKDVSYQLAKKMKAYKTEARYGKSELIWDEMPEDERWDVAEIAFGASKASKISKMKWSAIDKATKNELIRATRDATDGYITLMEEAIKVGDTVHLGHGTKGGTGVVGKVTKIQGNIVHIENEDGDTFKGTMSRVTLKESKRAKRGRYKIGVQRDEDSYRSWDSMPYEEKVELVDAAFHDDPKYAKRILGKKWRQIGVFAQATLINTMTEITDGEYTLVESKYGKGVSGMPLRSFPGTYRFSNPYLARKFHESIKVNYDMDTVVSTRDGKIVHVEYQTDEPRIEREARKRISQMARDIDDEVETLMEGSTFLEEGLRSAFKGGTKEINQFQAKLKEMGMVKTYLNLVKNLRGKDSGYGIFAKEEDRGEEYASRTGLGPSFSLSIEKVKGEKLGVEDVQKRGDTTYKRTLIVMKESMEGRDIIKSLQELSFKIDDYRDDFEREVSDTLTEWLIYNVTTEIELSTRDEYEAWSEVVKKIDRSKFNAAKKIMKKYKFIDRIKEAIEEGRIERSPQIKLLFRKMGVSMNEMAESKKESARDHWRRFKSKGVSLAIDRERYPNREREGLEGPYRTKKGLVYYYDRREGKYYDPDTDMYLDVSDVMESVRNWNLEIINEAWDADGVVDAADSQTRISLGKRKPGDLNRGQKRVPYRYVELTKSGGGKVKASFDGGTNEFVGNPEEVAKYLNKILGLREESSRWTRPEDERTDVAKMLKKWVKQYVPGRVSVRSGKGKFAWIMVRSLDGPIDNELRKMVIDKAYPNANLKDREDINYGNVTDRYISAGAGDWMKVMGLEESSGYGDDYYGDDFKVRGNRSSRGPRYDDDNRTSFGFKDLRSADAFAKAVEINFSDVADVDRSNLEGNYIISVVIDDRDRRVQRESLRRITKIAKGMKGSIVVSESILAKGKTDKKWTLDDLSKIKKEEIGTTTAGVAGTGDDPVVGVPVRRKKRRNGNMMT